AADDRPADPSWGVGEHTDYGVLTMLKQDDVGGLEVLSEGRWIEAPPVPGSFVCNLGDMLERMTGGIYRSTPHRVRNTSGRGRLSFPFFFDPDWTARVEPVVPGIAAGQTGPAQRTERWDGEDLHAFEGTYGDYVMGKVSKVFPGLASDVDD
ncbi:MAG: 2OG-Fe(II) oxygenase family protein, partial [Acidobacteriota bacterium]